MLTVIVPGDEFYNEEKNEFFTINDTVLHLEHSLVSLSKWEEIFDKPLLNTEIKTTEETLTYIRCMNVGEDFPPEVFSRITKENLEQIQNYLGAKMSATWFPKDNTPASREIITAELIYHWMIEFGIPFSPCAEWHLNKLFTLIKVRNAKLSPPKKMSQAEAMARQREINRQRREQLGTTG